MARKRYCPMCDDMFHGNPCPKCGADTDLWPIDAEPEPVFRGREKAGLEREQQAAIMREIKR